MQRVDWNCLRVMAGTLGCLVTRNNQPFILSNNHVIALVTTFPQNRSVGLLFAGNAANNMTFCNPIGAVLAAFGVNIVV